MRFLPHLERQVWRSDAGVGADAAGAPPGQVPSGPRAPEFPVPGI